ncbi:MAG TPA: uroporphyrinogen-III synthase [Wenzhouxiangellaceae bacterium]|nr:uroporphyrinogen-III synthase [Wenzhouxiangellaceae bacterium]
MKRVASPLVVTRPAPDHQRLMGKLRELGVPAIHSPAFEIEAAPESELSKRMDEIGVCALAIVTSPVAARLVARRAKGRGILHVPCIAPGQGTSSILEEAGLCCSYPHRGGTSEHILDMPDLADINGKRVAIVGAPGGRGLLANELARRGGRIETVHIYCRKAVPPRRSLIDALRLGHDPVVLISSLQAFGMISGSLPEDVTQAWLEGRFIVSSGRLEESCRKAGVSRIHRAAGAADDQMLCAAEKAGWMHRPHF